MFQTLANRATFSIRTSLHAGPRHVQRHETDQFGIGHFGEQFLRAAFEQVGGQLAFFVDQGVDAFLDRAAADELVDQDVALLADAEGPVGRLVLDRRVPPAVEMDDVRGGGQVQAGAARLEREDEERAARRRAGTDRRAPCGA